MYLCIGMYLIFQETTTKLNIRKSPRIAQNPLESQIGLFSKAQSSGEG